MTSPSTVFSRTRFPVFLCVSLLGLSSTSLLCLALQVSLPPFHDPCRLSCQVFLRTHHRSRSLLRSDSLFQCTSGITLESVASSVVIDLGFCGVSTTLMRFSSDQLFSASRRTLRAYTAPSSVRTRCSSVRSLFPSHTLEFPSVCELCCWISRSLSDLWKMCKNCFSKLHSAHGTIEWGLCLTTSQTRNEPRCMSDNPSHQCVVCGWSVLCMFSHCCQHCSYLSLQHSSIALM